MTVDKDPARVLLVESMVAEEGMSDAASDKLTTDYEWSAESTWAKAFVPTPPGSSNWLHQCLGEDMD